MTEAVCPVNASGSLDGAVLCRSNSDLAGRCDQSKAAAAVGAVVDAVAELRCPGSGTR